MEKMLTQLAHLFLESVPTVVFVFIAFIVLDRLLFRPLSRILEERDRMTRGALEQAEKQMQKAEAKARQYEETLLRAHRETYQRREGLRREFQANRESVVQQARDRADATLQETRTQVDRQVQTAKWELKEATQALARRISETLLEASG